MSEIACFRHQCELHPSRRHRRAILGFEIEEPMQLGRSSTLLILGLSVMLVLVVPRTGVCAEAPSKMTHAVVQMSGTDISADSFSAKPKIFWRASNQYCRVDEEPDPEKGIHGRLIVN